MKKLKKLRHGSKDNLTNVFTRNAITEYMNYEIEKSRRLKKEFVVIFLDLDNLKLVNDTHGHLEGDRALVRAVNLIKKDMRSYDLIGRWGGDEFIILVPEMKSMDIFPLLDRLSEIKMEYKEFSVTISHGHACFPKDGRTVEELIETADSKMYQMKKNKKNEGLS